MRRLDELDEQGTIKTACFEIVVSGIARAFSKKPCTRITTPDTSVETPQIPSFVSIGHLKLAELVVGLFSFQD